MQIPLQVVFRDVPRSEALDADIRRRVEKLSHLQQSITSCRVTIEHEGRRKHHGNRYSVGIDLTLPGSELVVKEQHEDVYVAVRDSFAAAERKIRAYTEQLHREGKARRAGLQDGES